MGVSPTKSSTSPVKQSRDPSVTPRRLPFSHDDQEDKRSIFPDKPDTKEEDDDDEVDTRCLLERMKVTVEEMKRRRSTLLVPQVVSVVEKEELTVAEPSLPASTGTDEDNELSSEEIDDGIVEVCEGGLFIVNVWADNCIEVFLSIDETRISCRHRKVK
jgi:hypothetical protein